MTRRALATIGSGAMEPVLALSRQRLTELADRHGYEYVEGAGESDGRPPAWGKVLLIRRLLEEYDEVLWIDSDVMLLSVDVDPASTVPQGYYQAFARTRLPRGRRPLNTGVWLLRGSRALRFLDEVWKQDQWTHHPWWEQRAVIELLGFDVRGVEQRSSEWQEGIAWLDDEWNSIECMNGLRSAKARHYASRTNTFRVERMLIDLSLIRREPGARRADIMWRLSHMGRFNQKLKQYALVAAFRKAFVVVRRTLRGRARV